MGLSAALNLPTLKNRPRTTDSGRLVGSRCEACGTASFPSKSVCHACGVPAPIEEAFEPTGDLVTHTTMHVPRPSVPAPYVLGQVRLDDGGPMVFGQIRGDFDSSVRPRRVRVRIAAAGETPYYWFDIA